MTIFLRHLIQIVESASSGSDPFGFSEHMPQVIENGGYGFYFEEGGCWGMAMALYRHFVALGLHPELVIGRLNDRDSHAMCRCEGVLYDYGGICEWTHELVSVDPATLAKVADRSGCGDHFKADEAEAMAIIRGAVELAQEQD